MLGWIIGGTQVAGLLGQQAPAAPIGAAFRGVRLPEQWGTWAGPPRVTREYHDGAVRTRAVGVWVLPQQPFAQQHAAYIREQVERALLSNLAAIEVPTRLGSGVPQWEPRGRLAYDPQTHGDVAWWSSGRAADTRTRDPVGNLDALRELLPEQADGPGEGVTAEQAARGTAREVGEQAQRGVRAWLADNWGLVLGGVAAGLVLWRLSRSGLRSNPAELPPLELPDVLDNPRPREWDVLKAATPYACKGKLLGERIKRGEWAEYLVKSCATPLPITAKERRRARSGEPRQQGAYLLAPERGGLEVVVRKSTVREGLRPDRGKVGEAPEGGAEGIRAKAREHRRYIAEQREGGAHLPEAPGLPYPHRPGSSRCDSEAPLWRDYEEAVAERAALLAAEGVPVTRETLAAALQSDSSYRRAVAQEEDCVREWERIAERKAPRATLSQQRERALLREQLEREGVDLSSAEYRDLLEGEQRAKARKVRSAARGGVRRAGGARNPGTVEVPYYAADEEYAMRRKVEALRERAAQATQLWYDKNQAVAQWERMVQSGGLNADELKSARKAIAKLEREAKAAFDRGSKAEREREELYRDWQAVQIAPRERAKVQARAALQELQSEADKLMAARTRREAIAQLGPYTRKELKSQMALLTLLGDLGRSSSAEPALQPTHSRLLKLKLPFGDLRKRAKRSAEDVRRELEARAAWVEEWAALRALTTPDEPVRGPTKYVQQDVRDLLEAQQQRHALEPGRDLKDFASELERFDSLEEAAKFGTTATTLLADLRKRPTEYGLEQREASEYETMLTGSWDRAEKVLDRARREAREVEYQRALMEQQRERREQERERAFAARLEEQRAAQAAQQAAQERERAEQERAAAERERREQERARFERQQGPAVPAAPARRQRRAPASPAQLGLPGVNPARVRVRGPRALVAGGEVFEGYNAPIETPDHPSKSHAVLAREGGQVRLLRFGQQGVQGSPARPGEAPEEAARRRAFRARHAANIARGKLSPAWWADSVKW